MGFISFKNFPLRIETGLIFWIIVKTGLEFKQVVDIVFCVINLFLRDENQSLLKIKGWGKYIL